MPKPRLTQDQVAEMLRLRAEGLTQEEVGRLLGVDRSAVSWQERNREKPTTPPKAPPELAPIPGIPDDRYRASRNGDIWGCRAPGLPGRFLKVWRKLKPSLGEFGYLRIGIIFEDFGRQKLCLVHRLIALTFLGEPTGPQVNHKDGVKAHNMAENLEWCSASENQRHAFRLGLVHSKGVSMPGEMHPNAKLTDEAVEEIRSSKQPARIFANKYGVCLQTVYRARRGEIWRHIK